MSSTFNETLSEEEESNCQRHLTTISDLYKHMHRHTPHIHQTTTKPQESCLLHPLFSLPHYSLEHLLQACATFLKTTPDSHLPYFSSSIPLSFPFPLSQDTCNTAPDFTFSLSSIEDISLHLYSGPPLRLLSYTFSSSDFFPLTLSSQHYEVFAILLVSSAHHLKHPFLLWLSCLREHGEETVCVAGTELQSQAD